MAYFGYDKSMERDCDRNIEEQQGDPRIDRSSFSVARLTDPDDSLAYWLSRSVEERLQAIESLRIAFYGADVDAPIQRVLEVAKLKRR